MIQVFIRVFLCYHCAVGVKPFPSAKGPSNVPRKTAIDIYMMYYDDVLRHHRNSQISRDGLLTLARTWGGWMPPPPGRFCALYPIFLKLEI